MTLDQIAQFISTVGFPIAVAVWLLLREDRYRTFLHEHEDRERDMMDQLLQKHRQSSARRQRSRSR